jgi:hypothetical protein
MIERIEPSDPLVRPEPQGFRRYSTILGALRVTQIVAGELKQLLYRDLDVRAVHVDVRQDMIVLGGPKSLAEQFKHDGRYAAVRIDSVVTPIGKRQHEIFSSTMLDARQVENVEHEDWKFRYRTIIALRGHPTRTWPNGLGLDDAHGDEKVTWLLNADPTGVLIDRHIPLIAVTFSN